MFYFGEVEVAGWPAAPPGAFVLPVLFGIGIPPIGPGVPCGGPHGLPLQSAAAIPSFFCSPPIILPWSMPPPGMPPVGAAACEVAPGVELVCAMATAGVSARAPTKRIALRRVAFIAVVTITFLHSVVKLRITPSPGSRGGIGMHGRIE
jgi:hypothetical protein